MGWSGASQARQAEAAAGKLALARIGYRGRVNADGEPLDGRGTALRRFTAGLGTESERADWEGAAELVELSCELGGGYVMSGHDDGLDGDRVAWPRGYRWDHRGDR
jgi:hypothetical protein